MTATVAIEGPFRRAEEIDLVGQLWQRLHAHHLEVSLYTRLVRDLDVSWARRRRWYLDLLDEGGALWIARASDPEPVGYAFATLVPGPDDTFESTGTAELVSLIVEPSHRGEGIGQALIRAVEAAAHDEGIDLLKVEVMAGNRSAVDFYHANGFELAEQILYRPVGPKAG